MRSTFYQNCSLVDVQSSTYTFIFPCEESVIKLKTMNSRIQINLFFSNFYYEFFLNFTPSILLQILQPLSFSQLSNFEVDQKKRRKKIKYFMYLLYWEKTSPNVSSPHCLAYCESQSRQKKKGKNSLRKVHNLEPRTTSGFLC